MSETKLDDNTQPLGNSELTETREQFFESLKKIATNMRISYERLLTGKGDEYLISDFEEEIMQAFEDGRFHAAFKNGLISKEEFQQVLAHARGEWADFVLRLRKLEKEVARAESYIKRLTGQGDE